MAVSFWRLQHLRSKPCTLCCAVRCPVRVPDLRTMARTRQLLRRGGSTTVQVPKKLLDMPTEVLATICAFCDVPTKIRIEATCKRLRALLARPAGDCTLWGAVTVRVGPRPSPLEETTQIVSWLARRAAGIQTVIVRPPTDATTTSNNALHMALLSIAGAFQGTHVALEMRPGRDNVAADKMLPFMHKFWAAPTPHAQPGLVALAATLTRLEVKYNIYAPRRDTLRYLCSLTRLEEATLTLEVHPRNTEDQDVVWDASGGLPALRRLTIGWDAWCTEAILKEAGPQLTSLSLEVIGAHTPASWLTHLSGLRELTIEEFDCHTMATANFSHMTDLSMLELGFQSHWDGADLSATIDDDFTFLTSFRSLRVLTLDGLHGINEALMAAVLHLPKLERMFVKSLEDWKWSAANIGRLIARATAERPKLNIRVDDPNEIDEEYY